VFENTRELTSFRLHLKTVLSLIPDKLMPEMQDFFIENNIKTLHLNVDKMKEDNIPLTYNKTIMALQVNNIRQSERLHPLIILSIASYRYLQPPVIYSLS
jgi:hypothetical protein